MAYDLKTLLHETAQALPAHDIAAIVTLSEDLLVICSRACVACRAGAPVSVRRVIAFMVAAV